jgi:hypothetical protein
MTMWTGVPLLDIGGLRVDVTEMVTGLAPQLNVMIPPLFTALERAWKVQLDGVPVPTTVVGWLVSTGCASAGSVSVVHEPLGFPATGKVPEDPASLDVPLEAPESLEPLPELPPPLVEPELAPLPLDPAPLDPPLLDPAPLDPAPLDTPLPELDPSDKPPSFWPEAFEPVLLLHPIPSATERENESKARSARMVVLPLQAALLDVTGDRTGEPRGGRAYTLAAARCAKNSLR